MATLGARLGLLVLACALIGGCGRLSSDDANEISRHRKEVAKKMPQDGPPPSEDEVR